MTQALDQSLDALAAALRDGATTSEALADTALARQARHAESLAAYKSVDPDLTRAQARAADAAFAAGAELGPLQGLPVSVKDLYGVAGYPTFAGTRHRLPPDWEREGPVIGAVRGQLGVITGKTHTVEIAFGGLGTNPHWGTPRNPWDSETPRVPGGSSAGAAVSLIEGSAVLALGTDTSGSVRIPASMTGTVGLKTSYGRWPVDGIFPLSPSLDTAGILTRTVADSCAAFAALDPLLSRRGGPIPERDLAGLRIGVSEAFFWEECSPGIAEGVREALDALAAKGAILCAFDLPETAEATEYFRLGGLAAAEGYAFLKNDLPQVLDSLEPNIVQRMSEAGSLPAHAYIQRRRRLAALSASASERMRAIDVVAAPTVPITPPTIAEVADPERYRVLNLLALRNTSMASLLGLCALTLPVSRDAAGMPVGLMLTARFFDDEGLLAAARAIETVLGNAAERLGRAPLGGD